MQVCLWGGVLRLGVNDAIVFKFGCLGNRRIPQRLGLVTALKHHHYVVVVSERSNRSARARASVERHECTAAGSGLNSCRMAKLGYELLSCDPWFQSFATCKWSGKIKC